MTEQNFPKEVGEFTLKQPTIYRALLYRGPEDFNAVVAFIDQYNRLNSGSAEVYHKTIYVPTGGWETDYENSSGEYTTIAVTPGEYIVIGQAVYDDEEDGFDAAVTVSILKESVFRERFQRK